MCRTSCRPYFENQGSASALGSLCTKATSAPASRIDDFTAATSAIASRQKVQPNDRSSTTSVGLLRLRSGESGGSDSIGRPLLALAPVFVEAANAVRQLLDRHGIQVVHPAEGLLVERQLAFGRDARGVGRQLRRDLARRFLQR